MQQPASWSVQPGPSVPPGSYDVRPMPPPPKRGVVIGIVVGVMVVTVAATVGLITYGTRKLAAAEASGVVFDNLSSEKLTAELDGKVVTKLAPRGSKSAVDLVTVSEGRHTIRILDGSGRLKETRTLDFAHARIVWSLGGKARYALASVHYTVSNPSGLADEARLLPANGDQTLWQYSSFAGVDDGIDQPFPEKVKGVRVLRHVCRVVGNQPQCEGAPAL